MNCKAAFVAAVTVAMTGAAGVSAQVSPSKLSISEQTAASSCRLVDIIPRRAPPGGAGMLVAVCGAGGVPLGFATTYSETTNVALQSILIVTTRLSKTRVWLAFSTTDGKGTRVADLTGELARLGGRAPDLGLGGLAVDKSRFAVDASVGILGVAKRLDLTSYVTPASAMDEASASSIISPIQN